MYTLRIVTKENETVYLNYNTTDEVKRAYRQHLPLMKYGAVYETNSREEEELAQELFLESERELQRREQASLVGILNRLL